MPELAKQQTVTRQTAASQDTGGTPQLDRQSSMGNAAIQEQLRSRQPSGKLSWQLALGEKVGGKLYTELSKQLTDAKLLGHANKAVDSALASLRNQLQGQVQPSEQEAADLFLAEIDRALKEIAEGAVVESGLSDGIRDYTDVHPYQIALAAAAGAVAYVLSNQDLPLIESKLGLGGGHSIIGGIDPGRTMHLALEQVRVGYAYQGDHVAAHLVADKFSDGWGAGGGVQYSPTPDSRMALEGSHTDRGGVQSSRLDLSYVNPDIAANLGMQHNVGGNQPGDSIGASLSSRGKPDELNRHLSGNWRSDGSWEAAAGIGKSDKNSSWSVEAFGGRDAAGNQDHGVRALYKLRF